MFDFLGFLKPVTKWLMDNWGFFGMFAAMAMPVILLALAVVLVGAVIHLTAGLGVKGQVKKAEKLRREGKYEAAYELYVKIHEKHQKEHIITSYDIGMLCKEGEKHGWRMREWENSSQYWFKKSLNPLKPETHYEYALCIIESEDLTKAAEGAKHMKLAARLGCDAAKPIAENLELTARAVMAKGVYSAAAGLGDAEAQYMMARKASGAEAVAWLELAADQKHLQACEELGIRYARGEGVKENLSKAVSLLTEPAEQGSMNAQAYLGLIYNNKKYPRRDEDTAIHWYRKAAEQGHPYSMHNLAVIYANRMDEYAKAHNLTSRLDRLTDKTYMKYYDHFTYWKNKAEANGVKP